MGVLMILKMEGVGKKNDDQPGVDSLNLYFTILESEWITTLDFQYLDTRAKFFKKQNKKIQFLQDF